MRAVPFGLCLFALACGDEGRAATDAALRDATEAGRDAAPLDASPDLPFSDDAATDSPTDAAPDLSDTAPVDGGAPDAPASTAVRLFDSFREISEGQCLCNFNSQGYDSVENCSTVGAFSLELLPCFERVVEEADADAAFECFSDAQNAAGDCLKSASCELSKARAACVERFRTAIRRCGSSPTIEERLAALRSDLATCATGTDDACPAGPDSSDVGIAVFEGSTIGAADSRSGGCLGNTPDRSHRWVAPTTGRYAVDTAGSDFDTQLAVYENCASDEVLACNDDGLSGTVFSRAEIEVRGGEAVVFVVGGFFNAVGRYRINVREL
ncbi:MAG: hypothetical protein AAF411_11310 [Myxococcota bacterium]